jgi:acyl-CoA dehydrogenase
VHSAYFKEEHNMLREQLRRFIDDEVKPHGEQWEEDRKIPREVLRRMGELGFLGVRYPEKYGGSDMDIFGAVVLAEELELSTFAGFNACVTVHTDMASPHLFNAGNEAQLDRYMPGIISGEIITAVAVTEPDAGSDVAGLRTRARREGDEWVINGAKMFITNGVHADVVFVAARTDPEAKGSQGISMFIVERGTPGFSVGRQLEKMGWHCSDTAELVFEDCRIPAENLLGQEKAFGGTLMDKQAIRQRLAMLHSKVEAGRQLVYHGAWLYSQGLDCVREMSMVKALCGELVNEVVYDCQQFFGGMGYMRESPIERMVRDARVFPIGGGATEVMLEEVAKRWDGGRNW